VHFGVAALPIGVEVEIPPIAEQAQGLFDRVPLLSTHAESVEAAGHAQAGSDQHPSDAQRTWISGDDLGGESILLESLVILPGLNGQLRLATSSERMENRLINVVSGRTASCQPSNEGTYSAREGGGKKGAHAEGGLPDAGAREGNESP
jgi:hypothetical protein